MSVLVSKEVWKNYPLGGSKLLAFLALADFANDEGYCYPSIATIAKKIRLSRSQSQRALHCLIEDGFVSVIENEFGGAPSASRHYRINLSHLVGLAEDTNFTHATCSTDAPVGSHECDQTGSTGATQTVIKPSIPIKKVTSGHKLEITLQQFLDNCKKSGTQAIPDDSEVFEYAAKVGIEDEMVFVCWQEFKANYLHSSKRYIDWRAAFTNAVRKNYYQLWFCKVGEPITWTSKGQQARRAAA